jgi:hypothetical protein
MQIGRFTPVDPQACTGEWAQSDGKRTNIRAKRTPLEAMTTQHDG